MTVTDRRESFLDRHYLLIRRLHSLSGIVPIGVFLFPHLATNSAIVWGRMLNEPHYENVAAANAGVETFQHEVNFIHDLPFLILIEWGVLFLPILFHAGVGIWFATSGRPNVDRYRYQSNWRYTLQRISGYLGVLFIFMHITSLRFGWDYGGIMVPFQPDAASSSTARHFQASPLGPFVPVFYLACVLALVFHFANGLWTAAITWGLTVSATAQQRWGYICAAVGIALSLAGLAAIWGFTTLDIDQAAEIEALMRAGAGHGEVLTDPAALTSAGP
ncbi:MAG: succinate dehydrogenase/fumarate reductase transmembrane subunit [Planctomycetota bacterium]|jgi:succinate dehydrogenase / fumarate reductase cytochrome b subunit